MATYGDESIDSYFYSSYNPYSGRYPKAKGAGWRQKNYFANYGDTEAYFDNHQRAQLKSILSQINPKLTPRLRKANTKDVAVQVNPKTDASVQCSLGPRTLMARKRDALRKRRQEEVQIPGSPVRYPRTLAVYSPIASRRLASFLDDTKGKSCSAQTGDSSEGVDKGEGEMDDGEEDTAENKTDATRDEKPGTRKKSSNKKNDQSNMTEDVKTVQDGLKAKNQARVRFQVSLMVT